MPNRILREGILSSERVEKLNWSDEVFFRRVISVVDDFGRYYARPALLRAACYPLLLTKVSELDIDKWLAACVSAGLIQTYAGPDGKRYLTILNFKQQRRAEASKYPDAVLPCITDAQQTSSSCVADAQQTESFAHLGVFVCEGVDVIGSAPKGADRFEEFWNELPSGKRKGAKPQCKKVWLASNLDAKADEIIRHVNSMREEWEKLGGQYMPAPLVYLNQQRGMAQT